MSPAKKDAGIVIIIGLAAYTLSLIFDLAEHLNTWLAGYEHLQLDEVPFTLFVLALLSTWFSHRRIAEIRLETERRKAAEEALSTSQRLYKTLFDGDLAGNFVMDVNGNVEMFNEAFANIVGGTSLAQNIRHYFRFEWSAFIQQLSTDTEIHFGRLSLRRLDHLPCYVVARFVYMPSTFAHQSQPSPRVHGYLVDITEQCLAEFDLEKTLKENQVLARHAMQVQEKERKHIAREIHDETGQYLTAIRMDALAVQKSSPEQVVNIAHRIASNTEHIQKSVRALIKYLRPLALDSVGLIGAIEQLLSDTRKLHPSIHYALTIAPECKHLSEEVNIVVFRVIQEALTNIARHAHAANVGIVLGVQQRQANTLLSLEIHDDGAGIDQRIQSQGVGLVGMRERIESLQGAFNLKSARNAGTLISATIPIASTPPFLLIKDPL